MKKFTKVAAVALVCMLAVAALVACGPSPSLAKTEAKLKMKGYTVSTKIASVTGNSGPDYLTAEKDDEYLYVMYYKSAKQAKRAWNNTYQVVFMQMKDDLVEALGKNADEIVAKRSGKMIYLGTKAAIKDAA